MEISLLTDIGQKRSNNQDFVNKFVNKAGVTLVIVADGMGGHRAGNIASEMSVSDLGRDWINTDFRELSQIRDWMIAAIDAENRKIYELGQNEEYKKTVMPAGIPKVAIEAGVTLGWSRYTGSEANIIGIDKFGASAPGDVIYEKYGFTVENVVKKVKDII